jgi:hypothetical protein
MLLLVVFSLYEFKNKDTDYSKWFPQAMRESLWGMAALVWCRQNIY